MCVRGLKGVFLVIDEVTGRNTSMPLDVTIFRTIRDAMVIVKEMTSKGIELSGGYRPLHVIPMFIDINLPRTTPRQPPDIVGQ